MVKCYTSVLDLSDTFPELSCQICQAHHKQQSHLSCAELALVSIPPNVEFIDFYSLLIYFVLFILNYHLALDLKLLRSIFELYGLYGVCKGVWNFYWVIVFVIALLIKIVFKKKIASYFQENEVVFHLKKMRLSSV